MRWMLPTIAISLMVAGNAFADAKAPIRKAFDLPQKQPAADCMKTGLWMHAAYTPSIPDPSLRCSHLLSTDTLISVHRWDKT